MDKNKKQDYLVKTLIFQFIICVLIFSCVFVVNYFETPAFSLFKEELFSELNKNIAVEEVEEAFKKIENFATDEFVLTDFSEDLFNAEVLGEGGKDEKINIGNVNYSFEKYKLNYKIYNPVINAQVSSEFGERVHPISGDTGVHKGIDLALNKGEPIYAIYDGEVVESSYDQWNGNYIKIKHDNDIMSVYCHCEKLFVEKGDVIRGGEKIATVGSTGQSTGPHLHFEIRIKNISYNPEYALKDAKNAV
jgi:murein DD-endopeptidase MepM/ murein hydrolase activator NlpD